MDTKFKYKRDIRDFFLEKINYRGYCYRSMSTYMECPYGHACTSCEYADRFKQTLNYNPVQIPAANLSDCIDERKIKTHYYKKVVLLNPSVLPNFMGNKILYHQMFYCTAGPGMLPTNPCGEIDGYFLYDPDNEVTIHRFDVLGLPKKEICEKFDRYYFFNTVKNNYPEVVL